jgi:hypothetical protein
MGITQVLKEIQERETGFRVAAFGLARNDEGAVFVIPAKACPEPSRRAGIQGRGCELEIFLNSNVHNTKGNQLCQSPVQYEPTVVVKSSHITIYVLLITLLLQSETKIAMIRTLHDCLCTSEL